MTDNPYQKKQFIEKLSQTCSLFKAIKNGQPYFMYEYSQMNQCDQYNFKIIKKLIACVKVLGVVDKYEYNDNTYFITQYVESNLLKQQLKQTNQIFDQGKALEYFAKIVQLIEELHGNGIIYRNFRLEAIGFQKKELYLNDFRLSQIVRRRERYFDVVGVPQYLAPEFYLEDGCGYQVDVWAAGVCLYFMLTACYPFKTQNLTQQQILQQIQKKCKKGFDFQTLCQQSKKSKHIQPTSHICDLFKRIFSLDYSQRITVKQIKQHPAMKPFFEPSESKEDQEIMSVIQEESLQVKESYFVSMFKEYPCHYDFHKEEVVLDFLEHSSEILMLNSPESISEKVRYAVSFSVLKVAMMKVNNLIDVLYGKREPDFKVAAIEWQSMRKKACFGKIKQKIQKKKKILEMLFRSACLNVQSLRQSSKFYTQQIPQDFATIKPEYRNTISKMFDLQMEMMRKKESREAMRKHCQNLVRLTILGLINRIFQEPGVHQNFQLYFKWAEKESLQDLEEWIQNQKMNNLKMFVKTITAKYMKTSSHENKE